MVSNDLEQDEAVRTCVVASAQPRNPSSRSAQCAVEVAQTLIFTFGAGPAPTRLTLTGPANFSRTIEGSELFIDVGMPTGTCRFEGTAGQRVFKGTFIVARPARRILRFKYKNREKREVDYLAIAGFPPRSKIKLFLYDQITDKPDQPGNSRSWRRGEELDDITADDRGEARWSVPDTVRQAETDQLIVSEPTQQNSLNAARSGVER